MTNAFHVLTATGSHVETVNVSGPADYARLSDYRARGYTVRMAGDPTFPIAPASAPIVTSASVADVVQRRTEHADRSDWTMQVNEADRASAERDADMLRAMGLQPGRTVYAPGMPLVRWGLDKWHTERDALASAPDIGAAAADIGAIVASEGRRDCVASLTDVRLSVDPSGALRMARASRPGVAGLRIERNGLQALVARGNGTLPGWTFVQTMTGPEIADLWNARIARTGGEDTIKVRARKALDGDGFAAFGIVSTRYEAHDCDAVAADVAAVLGNRSRGALVYDADRVALSWDVGIMRDVPPVVGEVWKIFHRGRTADDGSSSVQSGGGYLRVLCCNLTTETLETASARKRHIGASLASDVRAQLANAAAATVAGFEGFGTRWATLAETPASVIPGAVTKDRRLPTIADAIGALVDGRASLREVSGIKRDALVEALLRGVAAERVPADGIGTLADVVNAVTRLHSERIPVPVLRAIEADAGQLTRDLYDLATS